MSASREYIREGAEIYRRSFSIIRAEADLSRFSGTAERIVVRMIHACGMTDLPKDVGLSPDFAEAAEAALQRGRLEGALVVFGNAPTALFHLLEMLDAGAPKPAAIIGIPVGFIGAAESKEALSRDGRVPYLVVHGRRGGSAMAAAAVNALANPVE